MTKKEFFSVRTGNNPNTLGFALKDLNGLFNRFFTQLADNGYFHEAFGFYCVDDPIFREKSLTLNSTS
jgi:hypothetical protein